MAKFELELRIFLVLTMTRLNSAKTFRQFFVDVIIYDFIIRSPSWINENFHGAKLDGDWDRSGTTSSSGFFRNFKNVVHQIQGAFVSSEVVAMENGSTVCCSIQSTFDTSTQMPLFLVESLLEFGQILEFVQSV